MQQEYLKPLRFSKVVVSVVKTLCLFMENGTYHKFFLADVEHKTVIIGLTYFIVYQREQNTISYESRSILFQAADSSKW